MDSKNYTQVLIDGRIYTLGGSEDEAYLQKAASYVNEKSAQMRGIPGFSKQNADYQTVMTELNIADDYFKALEWAEGMERQKNNLEKQTYSLKHELVSTQMKLEAVLKDLEDRQRELDRLARADARQEGELSRTREELSRIREGLAADRNPAQAEKAGGTQTLSKTRTVLESVLGVEMPSRARDIAEGKTADGEIQEKTAAGEIQEEEGEAAAALEPTAISDEEDLARKALQAAKKANSHRGGRR